MIVNQILNATLNQNEIISYGWRIPFIFGGLLCFISYKIRQTLNETAAFNKIHDKPEFPLAYLFRHHLPQLIAGAAATAIMSGLVVVAIIFMPTYLHSILGVDNKLISQIMPLVMLLNVITIYITGRIANHSGPYLILRNLLLASIVLGPVSFWLISQQQILLGVVILGILEGVAAMIIPYLITCLFPAKIRLTGVAMSYNLGFTIFGGMAPIIISSSIKAGYGVYSTQICYLLAIIAVAAIGLLYAKRHSHDPII
jgi:predicted MFS family arabinose efflux permease